MWLATITQRCSGGRYVIIAHEHRDPDMDMRVMSTIDNRFGGALRRVALEEVPTDLDSDEVSVLHGCLSSA